jgi:hypothetical protein
MCPLCIATAALMVVGTASTGVLTALAVSKLFRTRNRAEKIIQNSNQRRIDHGAESKRAPESRVTN